MASIILCKLYNIPLDIILFSEVMFDEGVSGENLHHIRFIKEVCIPLFESWGYEVKIVRSDTTYLKNFYTKVKTPRTHIENEGKYRGFPASGMCTIQRDCKKKPIREFLNSLNEEYVVYLGICVDEPKRLASMRKDSHNESILERFSYTQADSLRLCREWGLLSPVYELENQKRGGCWFCPWAKEDELREAKKAYPDAFRKFVSLEDEDNLAGSRWNPFKDRLRDVDARI